MVAILTPRKGGKPIVVDKAVVLVGRHPDCDYILTKSRKVSRRHCCVVQVNDEYRVRDLGSMNGISLNGKRVTREAKIGIGDELMIGDMIFRFEDVQRLPKPKSEEEPALLVQEEPEEDAPPIVSPVTPGEEIDISKDYPVLLEDDPGQGFQVVETISDDQLIELKPLDQSAEGFAPILDIEDSTEDFDGEIEEVLLLDDDEGDFLDDDDIVLLD